MFAGNATLQVVTQRASSICRNLQDGLNAAHDFWQWLSAQSDAELTAIGLGDQDIIFLRSAFADLMALMAITSGDLPPATYPQPAAKYDYTANAKQIAGP